MKYLTSSLRPDMIDLVEVNICHSDEYREDRENQGFFTNLSIPYNSFNPNSLNQIINGKELVPYF